MNNIKLIDKLYKNNNLKREELLFLLKNLKNEETAYLYSKAAELKEKYYGKKIYLRGLIEISSYCKQACRYCGINRTNKLARRYRLSREEIIETCALGYNLGYRTFVLQGGEDDYFTDELLIVIIKDIKDRYPEVAITLSLGEKDYESYKKLYEAGADRYLLRHETCNESLYRKIHRDLEFEDRKKCLYNLKEIGYQVGAGFMIGIPGDSLEDIGDNILFLKEMNPDMVGMGPFIPHSNTIYRNEPSGSLDLTLKALSLVRLFLPEVLLPATTALSTVDTRGREYGFRAGCNVIMPNLSPESNRGKYNLYDDKLSSGKESGEELRLIEEEIERLGLEMDMSRGDSFKRRKNDR